MSEIDDIFASKGKGKALTAPPPNSSHISLKKRKRVKKRKTLRPSSPDEHKDNPPAKKRHLPETIVDSSTSPPVTRTQRAYTDSNPPAKRPKTKEGLKKEEQFKNSRGSGLSEQLTLLQPTAFIRSAGRKTEEGWNIYKEDELCLAAEGGDTPLCPFDCECCF